MNDGAPAHNGERLRAFADSSDACRGADPLRHAATLRLDGPLTLESGGELPVVDVTYETYGQLSAAGDNAVLVCHALSGDSHVAGHDADDAPGWWEPVVGPGKAIDTDRYFVVCPNVLGGCRGTTGPDAVDPRTGRAYGPDFPDVTVGDMVEVQRRLIDRLGIDRLLAVVGGSMGGQQAMLWPIRHPGRVAGAILLATSMRLSAQALAFDVVGRNAILHDPSFAGGRYPAEGPGPEVGLAIARMIGHITYLSREAMAEKFGDGPTRPRDVPVDFEKEFAVGSYLGYQGAKFVERFDANSYITLTMAMDRFEMGASVEELTPRVAATDCRWLVVSFSSDWLFSPAESRQIVDALVRADRPVTYCNVASTAGHDAFLLPADLDTYGGLMEGFLANLRPAGRAEAGPRNHHHSETSIFHPEGTGRLDVQRIVGLIPPSTSVLDLGCGTGVLLEALSRRSHGRLVGIELDEPSIIACARAGLNVIQADLNEGLSAFGDGQFDFVVLSQTLQSIRDVRGLLAEMLRVGRRAVVSFPNLGYHKLRHMLAEQGRAPTSAGLLHHKWHDSPNIRFFTIADFRDLCEEVHLRVHRCMCLDTELGRDVEPGQDCNLNADLAIFVLSPEEP